MSLCQSTASLAIRAAILIPITAFALALCGHRSSATSYADGTLIMHDQGPGKTTIYVVSGGKKRPIPNWHTFVQHGWNLEQVKNLPQPELESIQTGNIFVDENMIIANMGPGGTTYLVSGGKKRALNQATFDRLGLDWANLVRLPDEQLNAIPDGPVFEETDIDRAFEDIIWAWKDHGPCSRFILCSTYFDSFGVNITFSDGSVVPFAHVQRLTTSAHDCIQNAKSAYRPNPPQQPDRGLAVEWVMASQIHNRPELDWLRAHPDAVLAALDLVH